MNIAPLWNRLSRLPGGRRMFSTMLGRMAPYTGSISPRVEELRAGYARVSMRDRRKVRNHLKSVHAIALMNLAEVSSGLALVYSLPPEGRAILTGLSIDYTKKARGTLTAEATIEVPGTVERSEYEFRSVIRDEAGDVVAMATARWLVGPREEAPDQRDSRSAR
jgi:acyl-coenzyme A thioesterase PaaI-like protein